MPISVAEGVEYHDPQPPVGEEQLPKSKKEKSAGLTKTTEGKLLGQPDFCKSSCCVISTLSKASINIYRINLKVLVCLVFCSDVAFYITGQLAKKCIDVVFLEHSNVPLGERKESGSQQPVTCGTFSSINILLVQAFEQSALIQ